MLGNIACYFVVCEFYIGLLKLNIFIIFFQENHQSVKQFGPRSVLMFCGSDLDPNCLQMLSAGDKVDSSEKIVNNNFLNASQKCWICIF